jgi:hypothetical protein
MIRHLITRFYKRLFSFCPVIIILLLCLLLYSNYKFSYHDPQKLQATSLMPSTTVTINNISNSLSSSRRKIIYAFPFNHEFEVLEAIFNETGDLIEKYIVLESNYSAFGEQKPMRLYTRLKVNRHRRMAGNARIYHRLSMISLNLDGV